MNPHRRATASSKPFPQHPQNISGPLSTSQMPPQTSPVPPSPSRRPNQTLQRISPSPHRDFQPCLSAAPQSGPQLRDRIGFYGIFPRRLERLRRCGNGSKACCCANRRVLVVFFTRKIFNQVMGRRLGKRGAEMGESNPGTRVLSVRRGSTLQIATFTFLWGARDVGLLGCALIVESVFSWESWARFMRYLLPNDGTLVSKTQVTC